MPKESRSSRRSHHPPDAAKQTAYARTTISVPRELKNRMELVGGSVNWSAVACQAFDSQLSEIEAKEFPMPELPDKDEAIERLRRLKNEPEPRDRSEQSHAYRLGQRWAMADAHPAELSRLEDFCRRYEVNRPVEQWTVEFRDRHALKELLRELTLSILGYDRLTDLDQVRAKMKPFWEQRVGVAMDRTQRPSVEFRAELVSGFTQGALDFWTEAKDRL